MTTPNGREELEQHKENMKAMFRKLHVPHIEVKVHEDPVADGDSPIQEIADTFECLVNTLVGDIVMSGDMNAVALIDDLKHTLELKMMTMAHIIGKGKAELEDIGKENTPMPKIFGDYIDELERKGEANG